MEEPNYIETNGHTEAGVEPKVKVEEDVTAPGLDIDDRNLMHALTSAIPEQLVPGATGNLTGDAGHFELDETTMRSLQQFMESHGLHTEAQSTEQMASGAGAPVRETTLAEGIAQHYLPTRQGEVKVETEEERKARAERVRLENRERKKRWREQNIDRNKDNDLRCRVNKRANAIYGLNPSPQKTMFIEREFKKRQFKRRGRQPSPTTEGSESSDMYAALINNPEFANILMNLLAQKGLDSGDSETSAQLLELLKSNPEFLKNFLSNAPQQEDSQEQANMMAPELQHFPNPALYDNTMGLDSSQLFGAAQPLHFDPVPVEEPPSVEQQPVVEQPPSVEQPPAIEIQAETLQTLPQPLPQSSSPPPLLTTPAPIPRIGQPPEVEPTPVVQTLAPVSTPTFAAIPMPAAYMPPSAMAPRPPPPPPSQDRVRALGFPPMVSQHQ